MEYAGKVSGFCISACLGCWEVEFLVHFWISNLKATAGIFRNCTFRVSESVKPHRGLAFFYPKNGIPTGVLGIQGVRKCKTPPGSGVFLSKKWNPHRGLGHSGCREVQNPTGVWRFFIRKMKSPLGSRTFRVSGSVKPHPVSSNFLTKKCQLHSVVCYLRHPESQNHTLYLLIWKQKNASYTL